MNTTMHTFQTMETRQVLLLLALVSAASLGGAYFFQHVIGLAPCKMCLWQRAPYWAVIGLGIAGFAGQGMAGKGLLALAGVAMAGNAGLGVYHVGVEQKWWQGPTNCTASTSAITVEDLTKQLESINVVRCDEIPWSFFGITLAGYSALISAGLAVLAITALTRPRVAA